MDQEALVAELRKLGRRLEKKDGPVALLMLLAPDTETDDRWNVVVSARGLDGLSRADAIKAFTKQFRQEVDKSHWPAVARVTVLRTDDPFVQAMTRVFRAKAHSLNLQSVNVVGIEIPKAILLTSHKLAA